MKGTNLEIVLPTEKSRHIQKKAEASLTDTLMNYGVSAEQYAKVSVDIKSPSGSSFWLGTVLPLALPILIIVFFFFGWRPGRSKIKFSISLTFGKTQARVMSRTTKRKSHI